jgi:hypothetical protein
LPIGFSGIGFDQISHKNKKVMETAVIAAIILIVAFLPLIYFTRRSSDIRLVGRNLVIRYPLRKKEINLDTELKSWKLQEVNRLWIGKTHAINLELQSGKRHHVDSRFNRETFNSIYTVLTENFEEKRKMDLT